MSTFRLAAAVVRTVKVLDNEAATSLLASSHLPVSSVSPILPLPLSILDSSSSSSSSSLLSLEDGYYVVRRSLVDKLTTSLPLSPSSPSLLASSNPPSTPTSILATPTPPTTTPPSTIPTSSTFTLSSLPPRISSHHSLKTPPTIPISDISHSMSTSYRSFFEACSSCDIAVLREDPSVPPKATHSVHGGSGLHVVAAAVTKSESKQLECINYLITEASVDVNARSSNGSTALHWAAGSGNMHAVKALLRHSADTRIPSYTWSRQVFGKSSGQLPLHWASESGESEIAELLSDVDPLSLIEVDERGASAIDVAEKALQFPVREMLTRRIESDPYVVLLIEREMEASKVIT